MEDELVNDKVDELGALEADEPLDFRAAFDGALIVDEPTDHELGHDDGLEADPDLLHDVAEGAGVLLVVCVREVLLRIVQQLLR